VRFVGQSAYPAYLFVGRLLFFVNVIRCSFVIFRSVNTFLRTFLITERYGGMAPPLQEPQKPLESRYSQHGRAGEFVTVGLKYRPNGHLRPF